MMSTNSIPRPDGHPVLHLPKNLQVGPLCYVPQSGSKYYDMEVNKAFRQEIIVESPIINQDIETTVRLNDSTYSASRIL